MRKESRGLVFVVFLLLYVKNCVSGQKDGSVCKEACPKPDVFSLLPRSFRVGWRQIILYIDLWHSLCVKQWAGPQGLAVSHRVLNPSMKSCKCPLSWLSAYFSILHVAHSTIVGYRSWRWVCTIVSFQWRLLCFFAKNLWASLSNSNSNSNSIIGVRELGTIQPSISASWMLTGMCHRAQFQVWIMETM